ncbi:ABC transporter permease [Rehaibacterium terrae]|jgi:ABC-2 type transport system permease protein|uniref:ABC-type polysaccharide/polyol phosphate export permease n=1 Tax=Rehaibacterium terrae TaxID=1341696 RepID=A0A7W7XX81_9GAMM|nr:ABC transporter permease [Rehaibacterium terrae]MBB5014453.1 ABC-type polysaccharide/polyol phosphate export permease [Rehaibacterium terrae]
MSRSLLRDYRDSLRYPEFWLYATWLEIVTKYRRSRLGLFWAIFPAFVYSFGVGAFFAHLQGHDPMRFIPHLGLGYIVFRLVTVSLSEATTACSSHTSFILDGRVRLTDYILRVVAKALFYFLVALPVVAVALAIAPQFQPEGLLTLVPSLLLVLLNVIWMGAVLAVVGARFPDIHELIGSVLMFSFLFTPILWYAEQAPTDTLRGGIARMNPLFHLVEIIRAPLLGEPLERFTFVYLAAMLVIGWGLAAWAYRRYARFVPIWI